jgi:hypothetical protein
VRSGQRATRCIRLTRLIALPSLLAGSTRFLQGFRSDGCICLASSHSDSSFDAVGASNFQLSHSCSIAGLYDTIHAWQCLVSKGLTFFVATSVQSAQSQHDLRTQFAHRRQPQRHRLQLELVTIYLQACHVNAEVCNILLVRLIMRSSWASHTIQSVCIHCIAESPVFLLQLSAVVPKLKSG